MDFHEVIELASSLTVQEYDQICKPYFMQKMGDLRWEVRFRSAYLNRFENLLKDDVRQEKIQRIEHLLLEDDAYK